MEENDNDISEAIPVLPDEGVAGEEMIPGNMETGQTGAAAPKRRIPRWAQIVSTAVLLLAVAGSVIHTADYSIGPGPATNVLSLIKVVGGTTYPSKGQLLLTTAEVSDHSLTLWDWVWAKLNPNLTTINRRLLIPPGLNDQQNNAQNLRDMEASKASAEAAAFHALGRKVTIVTGALVVGVLANSPSSGKLFENDIILYVDGVRTPNPTAAIAAIRKHTVGSTVHLAVRRATKVVQVTVGTQKSQADPRKAAIGVRLDSQVGRAFIFPTQILIDTQQIGGPSGGLVFALSIYDALTAADLTRGHVIAVTGTMSSDGTVGPIGAIGEKIKGARAAHADVFVAPTQDGEAAQARALAPPGMRVIGVANLAEAIAALRGLPSR